MKIKHIYILFLTAAPGLCAAQSLHENIGVEGKYVREVIVQDRINMLPGRMSFTLETTPLPYETAGVRASFRPQWSAMPATTPFIRRETGHHRGYLDLSAGSWLNSNVSAGYRFIDDGKWQAGVWLQHNSTSLLRPEISEGSKDVKRMRYDEAIGFYGSRRFERKGSLEASLAYRLGYFNYYGYHRPANPETPVKAPTQTLNDATAMVGWKSLPTGALKYGCSVRLRYFGMRDLYLPGGEHVGYIALKGLRETHLNISGNIAKPWKSGQEAGIDLSASALFYGGAQEHTAAITGEREVTLHHPDNYGAITLTPYYRFSRGKFNIRVGADIDLTFRAGNPGDRYGAFKAAPDIRLDWRTGVMGLFLNITGGSELQTLASLHEADYYRMPSLSTTRPVYTPLDATLGFNFGPFAGFTAGVHASYKISRHVPLGGWYTAMLAGGFTPYGRLDGIEPDRLQGVAYALDTEGINLSGLSIGARLGYELGKVLKISASGTYQPQNGETGYFNGYDRARWTAEISAGVHPVEKLTISAGYLYRGVRRIYTRYFETEESTTLPGTGIPVVTDGEKAHNPLCSMRLPDITDIRVGAAYAITPKIRIYVDAYNLLNRRSIRLPSLPGEGVSVTGGVSILF